MQKQERPIKRGMTLFCYSEILNVCMTLEDCFKDMFDMGITCVEILAGHVENYPNPPAAWIDNWFRLLDKYKMEPGEFGHWYDTRLFEDRYLDVDESLPYFEADLKLANMLGFKTARTKLTTVNKNCDPAPGWEKYLEKALVLAEKYDVKICSEVHQPTNLTTKHIQDYIDFIERTRTKHFGFTIDFGTFQNKFPEIAAKRKGEIRVNENPSKPEDLKSVLPYIYCCHAKFNYMDDNFEEITIPYHEVLKILMDEAWQGCLIGEYEGPNKTDPGFVYEQTHRHQILLKRIFGY